MNTELNEEIGNIVRNNLIKARAEVIEKIKKNKDIISKLDYDIECLLISRNALLKDNANAVSTIIGSFHFLCYNYNELKEEFSKYHFDSTKIQQAVLQLRRIFFDDRLEMFQQYNCVDINFNTGYDFDTGLSFVFSNGDREFSIVIPTQIYSNSEMQKTENVGGKVYISYWLTENYHSSSNGSLDINEVREEIKNFIEAKSTQEFDKDYVKCNYDKNSLDRTLESIYKSHVKEGDLIYTSYACTYNGDKYYEYSTCSY